MSPSANLTKEKAPTRKKGKKSPLLGVVLQSGWLPWRRDDLFTWQHTLGPLLKWWERAGLHWGEHPCRAARSCLALRHGLGQAAGRERGARLKMGVLGGGKNKGGNLSLYPRWMTAAWMINSVLFWYSICLRKLKDVFNTLAACSRGHWTLWAVTSRKHWQKSKRGEMGGNHWRTYQNKTNCV